MNSFDLLSGVVPSHLRTNSFDHFRPPRLPPPPALSDTEHSLYPNGGRYVLTSFGDYSGEQGTADWLTASKDQLSPDSPIAPLCEDVEDEMLDEGDRCYSTCQVGRQCCRSVEVEDPGPSS